MALSREVEARLEAKMNARADALSAQLSSLAEQVGRSETRLEQLLLAVTAQGPRQKSRVREGPPRERREAGTTRMTAVDNTRHDLRAADASAPSPSPRAAPQVRGGVMEHRAKWPQRPAPARPATEPRSRAWYTF